MLIFKLVVGGPVYSDEISPNLYQILIYEHIPT